MGGNMHKTKVCIVCGVRKSLSEFPAGSKVRVCTACRDRNNMDLEDKGSASGKNGEKGLGYQGYLAYHRYEQIQAQEEAIQPTQRKRKKKSDMKKHAKVQTAPKRRSADEKPNKRTKQKKSLVKSLGLFTESPTKTQQPTIKATKNATIDVTKTNHLTQQQGLFSQKGKFINTQQENALLNWLSAKGEPLLEQKTEEKPAMPGLLGLLINIFA